MPKESHAWAYARDRLAPFGVLHRMENLIGVGTPDTIYCLATVTGLLEMKATLETLKLEQVLFAETWHASGGLSHALLRADREWFLLDSFGLRRAYMKADPLPVVRSREFPLKEILQHLAPVDRRVKV